MHALRRIEEIRSTLEDGEEGAAEIRAAARALEAVTDVGEVLAAVADRDFPDVLIAAAEGRPPEVERAWLCLAAAGARRARQVLAWRASRLLDPAELAAVATMRRRPRERAFGRLAASAGDPGAAAAWSLLARLRRSELRALVRARPTLAAAHRRALAGRGAGGARSLRPVAG